MTRMDIEDTRRARDTREQKESARFMAENPYAIFVFGSNRQGIHGGGAAYVAAVLYGAIRGQGEGLQGRAYGIPTKASPSVRLDVEAIAGHVAAFLTVARDHPDLAFYVTRIGCGLAGHVESDIAPMFQNAPPNCLLPEGWRIVP